MFRVVLITDRHLCPTHEVTGRIAAILAAVPRGSVAIQVREKDLDGGQLLEVVHAVVEVAHLGGATVWVNDRVDVALAAGADGVHLPETGMSILDARRAAAAARKTLAIGCSRHTAAGVLAAAGDGADLVQLGPIWATPGKLPIGAGALTVRQRMAVGTQLVAVGGFEERGHAFLAAAQGADAVAAIRVVWTTPNPATRVRELLEGVEQGFAARPVFLPSEV